MFRLFFRQRQPQVFLFRTDGSPWTKIVITRPLRWPWNFTIGPFRSEADAEQAADHLNANLPAGVVYYDPEHAPDGDEIDEEYEPGEFEPDGDDDGEEWKRAAE